jgi:hypothetical protein
MRLARLTPVFATALVATSPLAAQGVLLRMAPPQGQVTQYVMVMETFVLGGPMAQLAADSNAPFMRMTAHQTSTVTVRADEEFTLRQVIDSAHMEFPAMPQMAEMMGQLGDLMRGTTALTRMTTRGRVLATEVTPSPGLKEMMANQAAGGSAPGGTGMGFGGGSGGASTPTFFLLPADPVRVGQTWRDSMTIALDSAGVPGATATFKGTFTLLHVEGAIAQIGLDGIYGMSGGELPGPISFTLAGDTRLDVAAGRQVAVTMDMKGSVPTPMGDMPMKMHLTMTAR